MCVCVSVCVCVCVCTPGLNSVQHFSSGNAGLLMESWCWAQGKRMRLGAARGTSSRRRLEAGRGGQAERGLSRKAPDGSRRKLLCWVGGGDPGLHSPGLPSMLSPHLRQLFLPSSELLFCLGFEAEPRLRRLWPRVFLCGAPPPAPAHRIQAPLLFAVQILLRSGFVIFYQVIAYSASDPLLCTPHVLRE